MTTDPVWRTDTVVALCASIRETRDFSVCPILADALEEAGYPETDNLAVLRDPAAPKWKAVMLVAFLYSDASALAAAALTQWAVHVGYDFETVLHAGHEFLSSGEAFSDPVGYNWDASNSFDTPADAELFWDRFALATGAGVPDGVRQQVPFDCPC